jgi:hypothetical protein
LDDTGKIVLDEVYDRPDPRHYFSSLGNLDYVIPGLAQPVFTSIIDAIRERRAPAVTQALDLGCSYGINAAILKYGLSMGELYDHYASDCVDHLDRADLVERDRAFYAERATDRALQVTGLDVAPCAVDYALDTEILDEGVVANLEVTNLGEDAAKKIGGADIVLSTGCIGYAREKTLEQLIEVNDRRPWMAHFVLRMFPYEPFAEMMAQRGYVTETVNRTFLQRRFASRDEQGRVLDNLSALGIDPTGYETEGWYHAELFLSRPEGEAAALPIDQLLS